MSESHAGPESPRLDDDQREQAADHSTPHPLFNHEILPLIRDYFESLLISTLSL